MTSLVHNTAIFWISVFCASLSRWPIPYHLLAATALHANTKFILLGTYATNNSHGDNMCQHVLGTHTLIYANLLQFIFDTRRLFLPSRLCYAQH